MLLRKRCKLEMRSRLERGCAPCGSSSTRCSAVSEGSANTARRNATGAPSWLRWRARFSVEFAVLDTRLNSEQRSWICGFREAQSGLEPMIHGLCSNFV